MQPEHFLYIPNFTIGIVDHLFKFRIRSVATTNAAKTAADASHFFRQAPCFCLSSRGTGLARAGGGGRKQRVHFEVRTHKQTNEQ